MCAWVSAAKDTVDGGGAAKEPVLPDGMQDPPTADMPAHGSPPRQLKVPAVGAGSLEVFTPAVTLTALAWLSWSWPP